MQIGLFFIFLVALVLYFLNRQRSQMNRLQSYRRFRPDWGRSRAGARRRRRTRFGSLRAEMTRMEEDQADTARGGPEQAVDEEEDEEPVDGWPPAPSKPRSQDREPPRRPG